MSRKAVSQALPLVSASLGVALSVISFLKSLLPRLNTDELARGGVLQAQLERLQGEESSRHYARIEAHRRLQKDELGGGALMQELEEENLKLRRQVADLGSALYKVSEDG